MRIADYSVTKAVLERHGFTFKKSFGQNFLTDTNILQKIVDTAEIDKNVNVIEIGPGIGALTEFLAENAAEVMAFEIDERLVPILEDTLRDHDNVKVINEDVLKADLQTRVKEFENPDLPIKVVANLPYYITTPILMHLIESKIPFAEFVVMMQKEVGERLNAQVGTKAYGSLSIVTQYYTETSKVLTVPKSVFMPPPNVDSIVVKLMQRETPLVSVDDEETFFKLAKAAFAQRRKTINNNYQNFFKDGKKHKESILKWLEQTGIDPKRRGETLSIQDFARLYEEKKNFPELEN